VTPANTYAARKALDGLYLLHARRERRQRHHKGRSGRIWAAIISMTRALDLAKCAIMTLALSGCATHAPAPVLIQQACGPDVTADVPPRPALPDNAAIAGRDPNQAAAFLGWLAALIDHDQALADRLTRAKQRCSPP